MTAFEVLEKQGCRDEIWGCGASVVVSELEIISGVRSGWGQPAGARNQQVSVCEPHGRSFWVYAPEGGSLRHAMPCTGPQPKVLPERFGCSPHAKAVSDSQQSSTLRTDYLGRPLRLGVACGGPKPTGVSVRIEAGSLKDVLVSRASVPFAGSPQGPKNNGHQG